MAALRPRLITDPGTPECISDGWSVDQRVAKHTPPGHCNSWADIDPDCSTDSEADVHTDMGSLELFSSSSADAGIQAPAFTDESPGDVQTGTGSLESFSGSSGYWHPGSSLH